MPTQSRSSASPWRTRSDLFAKKIPIPKHIAGIQSRVVIRKRREERGNIRCRRDQRSSVANVSCVWSYVEPEHRIQIRQHKRGWCRDLRRREIDRDEHGIRPVGTRRLEPHGRAGIRVEQQRHVGRDALRDRRSDGRAKRFERQSIPIERSTFLNPGTRGIEVISSVSGLFDPCTPVPNASAPWLEPS